MVKLPVSPPNHSTLPNMCFVDVDHPIEPVLDDPNYTVHQQKRRKTVRIVNLCLSACIILLTLCIIYILFFIKQQQSSPLSTSTVSANFNSGTTRSLSQGTIGKYSFDHTFSIN